MSARLTVRRAGRVARQAMAKQSGLIIRQHEREELGLRVEFVVTEGHRKQVRFSAMSGASSSHVAAGTALDVSPGGMGIVCRLFVPRMCEGTVRVFHPTPVGKGSDGSDIYDVAFEQEAKVRRVTLDSHEPTYALGLAFLDPDPTIGARVDSLLAMKQEGGADA